ncbi:MAG: class I SAM-dependent methyltransferase [Candidatus Korobacteraceae bacterium]
MPSHLPDKSAPSPTLIADGFAQHNAPDLRKIVQTARRTLSGPTPHDPYLESIATRSASHRFLANCTQAVYIRHISCLAEILATVCNRPANEISILDWGCGKGQITYLLRQRGFAVASCDIENLEADDSTFGQEVPIIREQAIDVIPLRHAYQLPFADKSFDCVISFGVLEHVKSDRDSLAEIRRILKDRGLLYITFLPYFLSWTQQVARLRGETYHDRLYKERRFAALVESFGFSVADLSHGQFFPKNSVPLSFDRMLEPLDRWLCAYTPLRYFATNLEAVLTAE